MEDVARFVKSQMDRFTRELMDLVRIPSISSNSDHSGHVRSCAEFLKDRLLHIGLSDAKILETPGHPIVYGEWLGAPEKPTVLIYGHYDVQPVDPLDDWVSPPFEPEIRNGQLFGRGTVDDKGQVYAHMSAMETHLSLNGSLPLNVKILIEGEEEIGSTNLMSFLREHKEELRSDFVVVSDTPMFAKGVPSICYGLRGLVYLEIELHGTEQDLHSGTYGGVLHNPVQALSEIIAGLKDGSGRIAVPGFYDEVIQLSGFEKDRLAALPLDEEKYRLQLGAPSLSGEEGYSLLERLWCRPTLDVNGIMGGYQGEGAKTVIPAQASAKISMRLVPQQDPETIMRLCIDYLEKLCPPTMDITITPMHMGKPFYSDFHHPAFGAAEKALRNGFGTEVAFIREGGSIPFVRDISDAFEVPCLLIGFGLPDENAHAPNEWLDMDNFYKGILSSAFLYNELSLLPAG